jgi:hypothetical protein
MSVMDADYGAGEPTQDDKANRSDDLAVVSPRQCLYIVWAKLRTYWLPVPPAQS